MRDLLDEIKRYKEINNLTNENLKDVLGLTDEQINNIDNGILNLDKDEENRIRSIILKKRSSGRKITKYLELFFRFISMIMPLVVILLCVKGFENPNTLILLLSIGVVCSSITILPKIDK